MLYLADVHGGKTECALPSIIAILKLWDKHEFSFAREGHTLRWFMREEGLISGISPVKVVMAGEKLSSWSLAMEDLDLKRVGFGGIDHLLLIYLLGGSVQSTEESTWFT